MKQRIRLPEGACPRPSGEGMGEGGARASPLVCITRQVRLLVRVMWVSVCSALATSAPADTLSSGAAVPEFRAALTGWLQGDEAIALPAMAAEAGRGNAAAQLLLGVINVTPAVQGPWLDGQDRAKRIALLRQHEAGPSLSGRSWFSAPGEPIAAAWARALQADAPMTVILDFTRLGEPRAAGQAAFRLLSRQRHGFAALADAPDFPAALAPFAALELGTPAGLDPADPHLALFGPHEADRESLGDWIVAHADAVAGLCETLCPQEEPTACRVAALAGLGGPLGLLHTGSPVETLLPSAIFNRSPKGVEMMLALMSPESLAASAVPSPCLSAAMK